MAAILMTVTIAIATVAVAITVTERTARVEPGHDSADERRSRKLQAFDCGTDQFGTHLAGADDKDCRFNHARQQRRIREAHDRRAIDNDQIEDFQYDRKESQQPARK